MGPHEGNSSLDEIFSVDRLLLLDCEYTCWEDSLPTQWADPRRPAELIEIALVEYDAFASSRIWLRRMATISGAGTLLRSMSGWPGSGRHLHGPEYCAVHDSRPEMPRGQDPDAASHQPLLKPHQLVDAVECGGFVTLRQSWIVEHRLHEVIDGAFQNHHRLPDMQQFGGPFANDVHAQNLARFAMKDELQAPASLILFTWPRPNPFTSQPSSKKRLIFASSNMPKQSTTATGRPVIPRMSSGVSFRYIS